MTAHSPSIGPTSFDSSMFPKNQDSPLIPLSYSQPTLDTGMNVEIGTTESPVPGDGTHKAKKKKKKNKKNKKHKHKHDKERERLMRADGTGLVNPQVSSLLMDHQSSDSNLTSPAGYDPPSSPEFEVI